MRFALHFMVFFRMTLVRRWEAGPPAGFSINKRGMRGNTYASDGWRSGEGRWSLSIETANAVQTASALL